MRTSTRENRRLKLSKNLRFGFGFFLVGILALVSACQSVPPHADGDSAREEGNWYDFEIQQEAPVRETTARPRSKPIPETGRESASQPETKPGFQQERYFEIAVRDRFIALTFDDGPHPRLTPRLLDLLKKENVRATFFVLGEQAAAHPGIVRRIDLEGHEIGNHSWNHLSFSRLNRADIREELKSTSEAIRSATGRNPILMRPPYGDTNESLNLWIAEEFGMKVILWSIDSNDWRDRNAELVRRNILSKARPGSIVLCHDIHASTIEAMPALIADLKRKGFRFVTVSELIRIGETGY